MATRATSHALLQRPFFLREVRGPRQRPGAAAGLAQVGGPGWGNDRSIGRQERRPARFLSPSRLGCLQPGLRGGRAASPRGETHPPTPAAPPQRGPRPNAANFSLGAGRALSRCGAGERGLGACAGGPHGFYKHGGRGRAAAGRALRGGGAGPGRAPPQ